MLLRPVACALCDMKSSGDFEQEEWHYSAAILRIDHRLWGKPVGSYCKFRRR